MPLTQKSTVSYRYKALSHPTRVRILQALELGRIASPTELSEELGVTLPKLSYHVRRLVELDCIELVDARARRGAIEHFYRACLQRGAYQNDDWAELPLHEREVLTDETVAAIWEDLAAADDAGTLDSRLDRHMTRSPLQLDDEGWTALEAKLCEVLAEAGQIATDSVNRIARGESEPVAARLMLMLFEAAPKRRPERESTS